MKTLTFERAGMKLDDMNDVGTGRIRTAFTAKDGNGYYLEMIAIRKNKHTDSWCQWERTGFVASCHLMDGDEITQDYIDEYPMKQPVMRFEWTLAEILRVVNSLGGDFDKVRIAEPTEYRVFKDCSGNHCNFGDK